MFRLLWNVPTTGKYLSPFVMKRTRMETQIDRSPRVLGEQGVRIVLHLLRHLEPIERDHGKLANITLYVCRCVGELCDKRW